MNPTQNTPAQINNNPNTNPRITTPLTVIFCLTDPAAPCNCGPPVAATPGAPVVFGIKAVDVKVLCAPPGRVLVKTARLVTTPPSGVTVVRKVLPLLSVEVNTTGVSVVTAGCVFEVATEDADEPLLTLVVFALLVAEVGFVVVVIAVVGGVLVVLMVEIGVIVVTDEFLGT